MLVKNTKRELVNSINSLKSEKEKLNDEIQLRMSAINESDGIESFIKRISGLKLELSQLEEKENLNNLAFYEKKYEFENSYIYKTELDRIRSEQKIMMRIDSAIRYYEDSLGYQNAKFLKKVKKQIGNLMLRAFNVESDLLISMVNYKNIATMENKIRKSHDTINKFGESFGLEIEYDYLQLKMQELILNHEYKEKEEEEKQEQREILEQMREEEKAQREMERELAKTRREEERYQNALDDAKKDLEFTQDVERTKLLAKIELLERNLLEAQEKERMISQAQLTKVGHVYVISNVGSFGENIFKIGMTRRLEPTDRVNELSNASVPFPFDVHAMLFSENAPELEKKLQKEFEEHRVNKVNCRKEFFKVSLEDIERKARQHKADIRFTKLAEAKQYRETKALEQREIN